MFIKKLIRCIPLLLITAGCNAPLSPNAEKNTPDISTGNITEKAKKVHNYNIFFNEYRYKNLSDTHIVAIKKLLTDNGYSLTTTRSEATHEISAHETTDNTIDVMIDTAAWIGQRSLGCTIDAHEVNDTLFRQIDSCITIDKAVIVQRKEQMLPDQEKFLPSLIGIQYLVAFTGERPVTRGEFNIELTSWHNEALDQITQKQIFIYTLATDYQYKGINNPTIVSGPYVKGTTVRVFLKRITLQETSNGIEYSQEYRSDSDKVMEIKF